MVNTLTDTTGEPIGVVGWCLSGAQMNGDDDDMSRLPVEPDGLWLLTTANELVSDEGVCPLLYCTPFVFCFRWYGSNGLLSDSSSGCLMSDKRRLIDNAATDTA